VRSNPPLKRGWRSLAGFGRGYAATAWRKARRPTVLGRLRPASSHLVADQAPVFDPQRLDKVGRRQLGNGFGRQDAVWTHRQQTHSAHGMHAVSDEEVSVQQEKTSINTHQSGVEHVLRPETQLSAVGDVLVGPSCDRVVVSSCRRVFVSSCLRVFVSSCLRVFVSSCLRVVSSCTPPTLQR